MSITRLEQIVGHEGVKERLRLDIGRGRTPNAYLFVGPEGVGKTTVAELIATAMLCDSSDSSAKPCGECLACAKVRRSNHPDFHSLELDKGKKQIRIDQVRRLQGELAMRPYEAQWKVVVVKRAENLNEAAQNALLKTLEEPPGNAMLILTAPSPQNLLSTIVSRCRIERFGPIEKGRLAAFIAENEGLDESEARLLAGLAGGSVGRALRMDMDFMRKTRPEMIKNFAELETDDHPGAEKTLGAAKRVMETGEDGLDVLASWLKDVAMMKIGMEDITHFDLSDYTRNVAQKWDMEDIIARFQAVMRTKDGILKNLNKALTYENMVMDFLYAGAARIEN